MEDSLFPAFICFGIAVICFMWGMASDKRIKEVKDNQSWFEKTLKEHGLYTDSSVVILGNSNYNDMLIYTKENYIYMCNKGNHRFEKVNKTDILDMGVEVFHLEKNTKRLVALTSTFDKRVIIDSVYFKLTTRNRTYKSIVMANGKDGIGRYFSDRSVPVDDANRLKLMLENDIDNLIKERI